MKANSIIVLTLLWSSSTVAQQTFEKVYIGSGGGQLIELDDQNLLTRITWQNGISIMDPDGQVVSTQSFGIDTLLGIISVRPGLDGELLFASGYRKDICSSPGPSFPLFIHPVLGRMDAMGNVLELFYYQLNGPDCWGYPMDLLASHTKDVVTWGLAPAFFALRVDSSLAPRWFKQFDVNGGFQFIKELPGGDLLAGMNMDTAGAVVARMDADGNFLWCKSYIRPRGMVHDVLIESDDSFIITGYTDSTASTNSFVPYPSDYHPKLFMMNLNGEGEVQWCKGYESNPNRWYSFNPSRIVRTQDGNYAVMATLGNSAFNVEEQAFLAKLDHNGDTLWTRAYGSSNHTYSTIDLLAYSDGGYLLNGIMYGDLPQGWSGAPYIFKADSLGHFSCNEHQPYIEITDLFPTDSSFVLTSIDGATAFPAFVNDTVFDPINAYDACVITSVPRYGRQYPNRPTIRPNPNTGHFTVEFADPLMAESYYSVYDTMGKLLFQRRLPTGATQEDVDLTGFSPGTYVLRFTDRDGVCYERVVLE